MNQFQRSEAKEIIGRSGWIGIDMSEICETVKDMSV